MKGRVKNSYFELRIPAEMGQNGFKMELEAFDFGKPLKLKWIKSNSGSLSFRFQNHIMVFFKSNYRLVIFRSTDMQKCLFSQKCFFFCFSFHTHHMPDQHNFRNYVSSCSPDYYQDTLRKNILTGWRVVLFMADHSSNFSGETRLAGAKCTMSNILSSCEISKLFSFVSVRFQKSS